MNSQSQYFMFHNGADRPLLNVPQVNHMTTAGPSQQPWNDWYRNCVVDGTAGSAPTFPFPVNSDRSTQLLLSNFYSNFPQHQNGPSSLLQAPPPSGAAKDVTATMCHSQTSVPFHTGQGHLHGAAVAGHHMATDGGNFSTVGPSLDAAIGQQPSSVYFADSGGGHGHLGSGMRVMDHGSFGPLAAANHCTTNFYAGQHPFAYGGLMANSKDCTMPPPPQQQQQQQFDIHHEQSVRMDNATMAKMMANRNVQVVYPPQQVNRFGGSFDIAKLQQGGHPPSSSIPVYHHHQQQQQQHPSLHQQSFTKVHYQQQPANSQSPALAYSMAAANSQYALQGACHQPAAFQTPINASGQMCSPYTEQQYDCQQHMQRMINVQGAYQRPGMQPDLCHQQQQQQQQQQPQQLSVQQMGESSGKSKRKEKQKRKDREIAEVDQALDRHLNILARSGRSQGEREAQSWIAVENLKAPFLLATSASPLGSDSVRVEQRPCSPVRFVPLLLSPKEENLSDSVWDNRTISHLYIREPSKAELMTEGDLQSPTKKNHGSKVPVYKQQQGGRTENGTTESPYNFTDEDLEAASKSSPSRSSLGSISHNCFVGSPLSSGRDVQDRMIDDEVMQNLLNISTLHPELRNAMSSGSGSGTAPVQEQESSDYPRLVLRIAKECLDSDHQQQSSGWDQAGKTRKRRRSRKKEVNLPAPMSMPSAQPVHSAAAGAQPHFPNATIGDCKADSSSDSGIMCDSKEESPAYGSGVGPETATTVPVATSQLLTTTNDRPYLYNNIAGVLCQPSPPQNVVYNNSQLLPDTCYGNAYGTVMSAER